MGTVGEKTLEVLVAFVALRLEYSWSINPVNSEHYQGLIGAKKVNTIEMAVNEIVKSEPEHLALLKN